MPEEINRLVTDAICDLLWTPSPDGDEHLAREGVAADKIERVGNIMIDSFELLRAEDSRGRSCAAQARARARQAMASSRCIGRRTSTIARSSRSIVDKLISDRARGCRSCFPCIRARGSGSRTSDWRDALDGTPAIRLTEPLSYIEFMSLVVDCRFALTDSGGVQEETSYLGIPCLTLRENTERPVTVTLGTNRLVKAARVDEEVERVLARPARTRVHDSAVGRADGAARRREPAQSSGLIASRLRYTARLIPTR